VRPFYVIGHCSNTIKRVEQCLSLGANGIECDVDVFRSRPSELCVAHGPNLRTGPGHDHAPSLVQYLVDLHSVAREWPGFALVYFDCKKLVATREHGATLLKAIRSHLIGDGADRANLIAIISVASLRDTAIFQDIAGSLGRNEALMIDQENDPEAVSDFFTKMKTRNPCFANGTYLANGKSWLLAPRLRPSIARACSMRDVDRRIGFVTVWGINDAEVMAEYVRIGVDGIVVDPAPPFYNPGGGLEALLELVERDGSRLGIRKATRDDRLFA
jgi:glycerophosphoryl diester phosphodiesterase